MTILSRRWFASVAALVIAPALAFAACGSDETSNAAGSDSVTVATTDEPPSLDPFHSTNLAALNIYYNVFDALTTIDAEGAVVPQFASDWTHSDDLKTWTFNTVDHAKFSDGEAVTTDDVVWTFESAKYDDTSTLGTSYLTFMESVEATGPDQVTFELDVPFAAWDRQVSLIAIVPQKTFTVMGVDKFSQNPIGSGPYTFESWTKGQQIVLTRNDDYWGEKGTYEKIVFKPILSDPTRANALQAGDVDVAPIAPAQVPSIKGSADVKLETAASNRTLFVGFNSQANWLSDVNIRRAVDMAIDRDAINQSLYNGAETPVGQLIVPTTVGFNDAIAATETNLEEAKQLVADSGYDGSPIILSYPTTGMPQIVPLAQAIAANAEAVGLNIKLDAQELATYNANWFGAKFTGIYINYFGPSTSDADLPLTMLLRSGGQGYVSDAAVDSLLQSQISDPDARSRATTIGEISELVKENVWYAPLFIDNNTYGVRDGVDFHPRVDSFYMFNE